MTTPDLRKDFLKTLSHEDMVDYAFHCYTRVKYLEKQLQAYIEINNRINRILSDNEAKMRALYVEVNMGRKVCPEPIISHP